MWVYMRMYKSDSTMPNASICLHASITQRTPRVDKPLTETARRLLANLETNPRVYGRVRKKKPPRVALDPAQGRLLAEPDWREGLDPPTQETGEKPG